MRSLCKVTCKVCKIQLFLLYLFLSVFSFSHTHTYTHIHILPLSGVCPPRDPIQCTLISKFLLRSTKSCIDFCLSIEGQVRFTGDSELPRLTHPLPLELPTGELRMYNLISILIPMFEYSVYMYNPAHFLWFV